jgi:hypothetical protein
VSGPLAPAGVHLVAGQRLVARVAERELRIDGLSEAEAPTLVSSATVATILPPSAATDSASSAATQTREALPAPRGTAASGAPASSSGSGSGPLGWSRRVAAGEFRAVVAEVESRGVEVTLRHVMLADLAALADAARYARRPELARRALLAERARFPGSPDARAAAFLLGRLADDAEGSLDSAMTWYDVYLSESPRGAFAAEALGRKLTALKRAGDPAARAVADDYLHRYPDGPYAAPARELLDR